MRLAELTERQTDVARLIAQGYTNPEIAKHLIISERTVHMYIQQINWRWYTSNRTQIAVLAIKTKLITLDDAYSAISDRL